MTYAPNGDKVLAMIRRIANSPLDEALWASRRTGRWLAEQLSVDEAQVSRWRRGIVIPSYATQRRIAKLLKVSVASLWPKDEA